MLADPRFFTFALWGGFDYAFYVGAGRRTGIVVDGDLAVDVRHAHSRDAPRQNRLEQSGRWQRPGP